ncbi:MAG: tetratricopeptide repeat protein, partial [Planctomycetota bacterium]
LLVEARPGPEQFLCCPPDSALYQLRAALDAGLDDPAAHVLHARIWQQLGRPDVGLALLRSRSVALLADPQPALLEVFADLSLATGNIADYLRFQRRRAERDQANASDILSTAYLTAADRHSERGDEALCLCCLRRAQRLRPDDPDLLLRLADMAWGAGRSTEARTLYHRLLELRPAHPQRARLLERLALPDESAPDAQTRGHASAAPTNVFSARVSVE